MFVSTRYQFIKNIANIFSQVFGPFQASSPGYLIKDKYDFLPAAHRLVVVVRGTFWSSNPKRPFYRDWSLLNEVLHVKIKRKESEKIPMTYVFER